jgi:hypothetical protein
MERVSTLLDESGLATELRQDTRSPSEAARDAAHATAFRRFKWPPLFGSALRSTYYTDVAYSYRSQTSSLFVYFLIRLSISYYSGQVWNNNTLIDIGSLEGRIRPMLVRSIHTMLELEQALHS